MTEVITALCRIIEECLAVIEDEATKRDLIFAYRAAVGEKHESEG